MSSSVGLRQCGKSSKTGHRILPEKQMMAHDCERFPDRGRNLLPLRERSGRGLCTPDFDIRQPALRCIWRQSSFWRAVLRVPNTTRKVNEKYTIITIPNQ